MSDETKSIQIAFLAMLGAVVLFASGMTIARDNTRREAVRNNCAHYEADASGASEFKWGPKP